MRIQPRADERRPAWVVGGHLGADFLNTVDARGEAGQREHLLGYPGLLRWMGRAGAMGPSELRLLRAAATAQPRAAERVHFEAIELREAAHRIVVARAAGRAANGGDVALVEQALEHARAARLLKWNGRGFALRWCDSNALRRPLFVAALALADLLEPANLVRVHICGGETCDWVFLDLSPTQRRRWCHMSACGNRAKVRRFRVRRAGLERN